MYSLSKYEKQYMYINNSNAPAIETFKPVL